MSDFRAELRAEFVKMADRVYEMFTAHVSNVFGGALPRPGSQTEEPPKRSRLSQEHLEEVLATVIELLKKHPDGLRSEQIRSKLNLDKKTFQYAVNLGKQSDQVIQSGERRATVYTLPSTRASSKAQEEGRVIKKKKRAA